MNYNQAYKKLNDHGIIDDIINSEAQNGANLNMVKYEIIEGINYYLDFVKSSTFKGMKYFQDVRFINSDEEKLHHKVVNAVCKALAEIEIAECIKYAEQLRYMIDAQR